VQQANAPSWLQPRGDVPPPPRPGAAPDISVLTMRTHRQRLMEKVGLRNAAEISACVVRLRLYDPT
jgi:hypothetical protein